MLRISLRLVDLNNYLDVACISLRLVEKVKIKIASKKGI